MNARCQCSLITFTTPTPQPLRLYICHCTQCRHQSSSAFGITAVFPYFEIDVPAESIAVHVRRTRRGRDLECLFCRACGARLLHRFRDQVPKPGEEVSAAATVNVKGGCMEGLTREMMRGVAHIWCREAVVEIPEGVERWEAEPGEEGNRE